MKLKLIYSYGDKDQFEYNVNAFIRNPSIKIIDIQYKVEGSSIYAFIHYESI
jgi:hypothetical protein